DFHKGRVARSIFPANAYSQPDDSLYSDVTATVEKTMKKYADNLLRFLEGISSRLSQLELYCYNLDKSIGEMQSDLIRDNEDADSKLKSIEKHLQEVHRSVQILRDKQELAETQKELAKLQLAQKESSSSSHSQSTEERASSPASDSKKTDHTSEMQNHQLALALPHQVAPQQQPVVPHSQSPPQNLTQQSYYIPSNQLSNPHAPAPVHVPAPTTPAPPPLPAPAPTPHTQSQYLPPDPQYQAPHIQDVSRMPPQPRQSHQVPPVQSFPQYQQQWPQQVPQQVQQQQQSLMQPQMRPPSTPAYPPYPPTQSSNPSPPEALAHSTPMQVPYSGVPQPLSSRVDTIPYGYGVPGRTAPQPIKGTFEAQPRDGYQASVSHPPLPPGSAYMMYDSEGGRAHHPPQQPHFSQGGYPPANVSLQTPQPGPSPNVMMRNSSHSQYVRNHPYSYLIEKFVSMGFRGDHIASVIQRMEESGQAVDFNAVLDRLNAQSSGGTQRGGW
ncbi:hypothetical protein Golax_002561, partial [Gossypium laxum]|nr:hypothetical protein [Gossypium laxum]